MFRKFLNGFVFGVGFTLAYVLVYTAWALWAMPSLIDEMNAELQKSEVPAIEERWEPPPVPDGGRFLGATSSYSGEFDYDSKAVLGGGNAALAGHVRANGEPVEGLRLRLALNGSVKSQWAVTDRSGEYQVQVPPGEYRVDGYDLDRQSAMQQLTGLIDPPGPPSYSENKLSVGPGEVGPGMDLRFIEPVVKLEPTGQVPIVDEIIARWEAYPGAESYSLQVLKSDRPEFLDLSQVVFERQDRPEVQGTEVDLREIGVPMEAGYFYYIEVVALDSDGHRLSRTPQLYWRSDFEVIE